LQLEVRGGGEEQDDDARVGDAGGVHVAAHNASATVEPQEEDPHLRPQDAEGIDFHSGGAGAEVACCGDDDATVSASQVDDVIARPTAPRRRIDEP
jgi:hypothetical protein